MGTAANPLGGSLAAPSGTGLALQPVSQGSDDLTRFIRSIEGLTATQGQNILGSGLSQMQGGINAAAPALSFLTALTQGDQGSLTQAAQPEIDQIKQQFDQIRNMISMQPRGGGKTSALAEAPFKEAGSIARTEGSMRTGAAGQLGSLASNLAGLGLGAASLGQMFENQASNIALAKEGQNYGQATPIQTFGEFTRALANLI
jgi:hypothetical protein